MVVRITTDRAARPNALEQLGLMGGSEAASRPNEITYKSKSEIFGEDEPIRYAYQVRTGAVRSYKLLSDGRRQIGAFHLEGDMFGLEKGAVHRFTAEAVVDTTVRLIGRRSLENAADHDASVMRNLISKTSSNLEHAENHLLLLGRKTALERVAAFLVEMDKRLTAAGVMTLPMGRQDIGDYLGLTIETVSRALSQLRGEGILDFIGKTRREIVIRDRVRLTSLDMPA
jgi:CRP/FNR family transcriptional regulator, nitrogen fixation regulation protein